MDIIPKWIRSKQSLIVFLVYMVIILAKYLTAFLIVANFNDRYMLIASTDDIVTSSLFNPISLSVSFRSEAWTMEFR